MGAIQSAVNKAIAGASAATVASPGVQAKIKEREAAAESLAKKQDLTTKAEKAATIAEQSKVDLPTDSIAKRYPIGKSKAERESQKVAGAEEVGKLEQSIKAQDALTGSLEQIYKNDPTEENFKKYMDQKAAASAANVPAQAEIQNIQNRLNYIEPDSIKKRRMAKERLQRRVDAKKETQQDLLSLFDKNNAVRVDQLTPDQKRSVIDAINQGGRR